MNFVYDKITIYRIQNMNILTWINKIYIKMQNKTTHYFIFIDRGAFLIREMNRYNEGALTEKQIRFIVHLLQ